MTTWEIIGVVASGLVVFFLLGVVMSRLLYPLVQFAYHSMEGSLEARIAAHYRQDEILMKDLMANSFGLESAGVLQVRGNGGLVLTADRLHFFMFLPRRDLRVPLDGITELTFTRRHLGRAAIHNLLKVRYTVEDRSDSIAWYLTDPAAWKSRIEELRAGRAARERASRTRPPSTGRSS